MLWLERVLLQAPKQILQDVQYKYDKVGKPVEKIDNTPVSAPWLRTVGGPSHESYAYDELYRVIGYDALSLFIFIILLRILCLTLSLTLTLTLTTL